jgi:lycopene cyclase CruP
VEQSRVGVCGGTLGVFLATALALKGMKVAIVERGPLRGRVQEWNVSRKELKELVKMGVLTDTELEDVIAVEFNPSRVGFDGGTEVWVKDILNLGVSLVFSSPSLITILLFV